MRGSPTYIINVLIVTLLPGSDGLDLYYASELVQEYKNAVVYIIF